MWWCTTTFTAVEALKKRVGVGTTVVHIIFTLMNCTFDSDVLHPCIYRNAFFLSSWQVLRLSKEILASCISRNRLLLLVDSGKLFPNDNVFVSISYSVFFVLHQDTVLMTNWISARPWQCYPNKHVSNWRTSASHGANSNHISHQKQCSETLWPNEQNVA